MPTHPVATESRCPSESRFPQQPPRKIRRHSFLLKTRVDHTTPRRFPSSPYLLYKGTAGTSRPCPILLPKPPNNSGHPIYASPMNRDQILQTLRDAYSDLAKKHQIQSLSLFGSFARGEANPDSDIDILVDFEPDARVSLFTLAGLLCDLEDLLEEHKVDLVDRHALRPSFLETVNREAIFIV